MNLLKNPLPSTVQVGGIFYKIDPFHDTALSILDLLSDELFTETERKQIALEMFYDEVPEDREEAYARMILFLNRNEEPTEDCHTKKGKKLLDYEKDGDAIYTHIWRIYGIDLQEHPVHWWKFLAMMNDTGERTLLQSKINIRSTDIKDVAENKRSEFRKIQAQFSLEEKQRPMTLEERNAFWLKGE